MTSLDFRKRLLLALSLFALVPAAFVTVAWATLAWQALPQVTAGPAWERVVSTGNTAIAAARTTDSAAREAALQAHERELQASATQALRLDFVVRRLAPVVAVASVAALALLGLAAHRVAGHFSRQLSRPVQELVGWTHLIQEGNPLPTTPPSRGAPEFEVLRGGMRTMASELAAGRQRAIEAERLVAFRESARRVAHELKNPLTPMQFAIAQLRRVAPESGAESLRVLEEETARLQRMATSFAQFGTLPTGPAAPVDVAELVRTTTAACIPSHLALQLEIDPDLPPVTGHHDPLQRALMNVVLNAVDACGNAGAIVVRVTREGKAVAISVTDSGSGIPRDVLPHIFEPYVTRKPGGTGLGLAIAEQAIRAHGGRVAAVSPPGRGATIRFTLPIDPSPIEAPA